MKTTLMAVALAATFLTLTTAANATPAKIGIVMVTTVVWSNEPDPPFAEASKVELVTMRSYISMMACREALANDHSIYAAQTAKEFKFIQGSQYRMAKQLIRRSSRVRCWIGPLPTQEQFLLPTE